MHPFFLSRRIFHLAILFSLISFLFFSLLFTNYELFKATEQKPNYFNSRPVNNDHWLNEVLEHHFHPVPIITIVDETRLPMLRELVGSIHYFRSDNLDVPLVTVYGMNLTRKSTREIQMWRNVELVDIMEHVFLGSQNVLTRPSLDASSISTTTFDIQRVQTSQWLVRMIISLALRKYGSAIYVDTSLRFDQGGVGGGAGNELFAKLEKNVIHGPNGAVALGFDDSDPDIGEAFGFARLPLAFAVRSNTDFAKYMVDIPLQCIRGYQCPVSIQPAMGQLQRTLLQKYTEPAKDFGLNKQHTDDPRSTFCYVLLRDDILYSESLLGFASRQDPASTTISSDLPPVTRSKNQPRKRMALLIPTFTVSELEHPSEVSPLRILVPSVLKTISDEEISRFELVLYFGFDEGDRYWDDPPTLQVIDTLLKEMILRENRNIVVHLRYIRIPFSKGWVTYIWNSLFVRAYHDDCDYFVQVNDDAELQSPEWMTVLTLPLMKPPSLSADGKSTFPLGFGVSGPKDRLHGHKLLFTQCIVTRLHYHIFGRLYPLDIKDWYSDDWITNVYGPDGTFQAEDSWVKNWNDKGTRYRACKEPRYEEVIGRSKAVVEKFVNGWRQDRMPQSLTGTVAAIGANATETPSEIDQAGVVVLLQR